MQSNWNRRVIPRWRASGVAASLPESLPINSTHKSSDLYIETLKELQVRLEEWKQNKSFGVTADLLNFSHIPGAQELLREPAEQILTTKESIPHQLERVAKNILGIQDQRSSSSNIDIGKNKSKFEKIASLRKALFENPRDAIALIDLARLYAALGQREKAKRAILSAISLWPDHRFVLRSATRFFIHNNETEHALYLLRRSRRTQVDPWLLATQIAAETVLGKAPSNFKKAKLMLDSDRFNPVHTSELGSAIATVNIINGSTQEAKRAFNKSLVVGNDNAIAQAVWASQHFDLTLNIKSEWFVDRFSAESNVYKKTADGDFGGAIDASLEWFEDEPFSTRPMKAASYAATITADFLAAERFSREGLLLDKDDSQLLHNLVCGLAAQNKTREALDILKKAIRVETEESGGPSGYAFANYGMILYREGFHAEGEKYYRDAIKYFEMKRDFESRALASAFMARQAELTNAENAETILKEAKELVRSSKNIAASKVLEPALHNSDAHLVKSKENFRSGVVWTHDALRNVLVMEKLDPFKVHK